MTINISVAICTYNRARLLPRALDSLLSQKLPADRFEILVVDNGSTDNTWDIVAAYKARKQNIRYIYEPILGIARARNRAISETSGKFIAFLDDDARATEKWLVRHAQAWQAGYQAVVGRVELDWQGKRPDWLLSEHETLLARYNYGTQDCDLPHNAHLITTNASFSISLLRSLQGFDESLGHRGRVLVGGEDNDLFYRIVARGISVRYLASAVVMHSVAAERLTEWWLIGRMFWEGMGNAYSDYRSSRPPVRRLVYDGKESVRHAMRLLVGSEPRWRTAYATLKHGGRFLGELLSLIGKEP